MVSEEGQGLVQQGMLERSEVDDHSVVRPEREIRVSPPLRAGRKKKRRNPKKGKEKEKEGLAV